MLYRHSVATITLVVLSMTIIGARAADEGKYPDWRGQWSRAPSGVAGQPQPPFDPSKPWGLGEEAPLTPEYQAIFEANLKEQAAGGAGHQWRLLSLAWHADDDECSSTHGNRCLA
jgi:hypothetical protein